jgi:hypothetical protein
LGKKKGKTEQKEGEVKGTVLISLIVTESNRERREQREKRRKHREVSLCP